MTNLVSHELEQKILKYIKEKYLPNRFNKKRDPNKEVFFIDKDYSFFAKSVLDLSEAFTLFRKDISKNYFNRKEYRSAYLLYFTLTNFAKTVKCLNDVYQNQPLIDKTKKLKILDLGCGPATASLACIDFFNNKKPNLKLDITAVDQNLEILKDGKNILESTSYKNYNFKTVSKNIINFVSDSKETYDLIIAANVLNEFGDLNKQANLCERILAKLIPGGFFIILDPALQKTTRSLMELRNILLDANKEKIKVQGPCLHQEECPMLKHNRRDWCHFYLEWKTPKSIAEMDKRVEIKHEYLKMAYLIIQKKPFNDFDISGYRIVSSPLGSNGKLELLLCAKEKIRRLTRFDRDYSEHNSILGSKKIRAKVKRGDIIEITNNSDHIQKDTKITISKQFNK